MKDADVDLDVLADYFGGVLDGTPAGARVADLIATDPVWARAAEQLSCALGQVTSDLARLSAPAMPDDVHTRLDDALRGAEITSVSGGHKSKVRPRQAGRPTTGSSRPTEQPPRPPGREGRRRRRGARWGAGFAAAAAAAGFAAFGISNLDLRDDGGGGGIAAPQAADSTAASPSDPTVDPTTGRPDTTGQPGGTVDGPPTDPTSTGPAATDPTLLASGDDYHRNALPAEPPRAERLGLDQREPQQGQELPGGSAQPGMTTGTMDDATVVPPGLAHLWPLPSSCLSAVQEAYKPKRVIIDAVDYARFEGQAALVIWITGDTGQRWVTIAGDQCGVTSGTTASAPTGADERHRTALR